MKLYPKSREEADRWSEDYRFLGYDTSVDNNVLTVVWRGTKKKKAADKQDKPDRNKRLDKHKRD